MQMFWTSSDFTEKLVNSSLAYFKWVVLFPSFSGDLSDEVDVGLSKHDPFLLLLAIVLDLDLVALRRGCLPRSLVPVLSPALVVCHHYIYINCIG